jgi:drug/metabolite transporter (DMT)-like permease
MPRVTRPPRVRTVLLTALALVAFAANSILCRLALRPHLADAAGFTAVRLVSGTLALSLILLLAGRRRPIVRRDWFSPIALFAYAAPFSFAYLRLSAGTGALLLFGSVQVTMIAWGMRRGERPHAAEWVGLALAVGGLIALNAPGATAPDAWGAVLMIAAGVAWGAYSLQGRGGADPLAVTAGNFARTVPLALILALVSLPHLHATREGLLLAAASGALASGVGYAVWYAALRGLRATRAAVVQLLVPVLAAIGGVLVLDETITVRLVVAGAVVLGGIALAVTGSGR